MATEEHDKQLRKIISKAETLEDARELFSLARVKTGPGSGRNLGGNAIGLPAVCAFLASERLGNNDVPEDLAQKASCLAPKNFQSVVATVRSALEDTLRRRNSARRATFEAICRDNFLMNEDALYWMDEVEKELERTGKLEELDVRHEAVKCAIYRFTCRLLGLPCAGSSQLSADYGLRGPELTAVMKILMDDCTDIQMNIEAFRKKSNGGRIGGPSSPTKTSRVSTSNGDDNSIAQRLKRKVSLTMLPPLPSPEKKPKTSSPLKLNRVPVPTARPMRTASTSLSPAKQALGTIVAVPRTPVKKEVGETPRPARTSPRALNAPSDESPAKTALEKMSRLALSDRKTAFTTPQRIASKLPSPQKSPSKMTTPKKAPANVAGPSRTPSPTKKRTTKPKSPSPEPDEDEEPTRPINHRHRRPPFLDRQFYTYRDPRLDREHKLCMDHFEELVRKFGFPNVRNG